MLGRRLPGSFPVDINRHHPANQNLRSWWTTALPHIAGGSTWYDAQGLDHGTFNSMGVGLGWQPSNSPLWPHAVKFDGSASSVTLPAVSGIISTRVFTYSLWLATTSAVANSTIIGEGNSGNGTPLAQLAMDQASGVTACLAIRDDANHSVTVTGAVAINDGAWHHVVYTCDGTTLSIYVDGKLDNSGSLATIGATTLNTVRFGNLTRTTSSNFWAGSLADVRSYPWTMNAAQVAALYRESAEGYPEALLWWRQGGRAILPSGDPVFPFPMSISVP